MMKWIVRITILLILQMSVASVWAQTDKDISESYRRLRQAVAKTRSGNAIQPQVTDQQKLQAGSANSANNSDQQLSKLAQALSSEQSQQAQRASAQRGQQTRAQQARIKAARRKPPTIEEEAFSGMTSVSLPLDPNKIRTLRKLFNSAQQAASEHPGVPPRPTSSSVLVNLAPGATPPIIRLSAGFVTSLVFIDATGAPWPIAAWDLGDPRSYNIQWDKKGVTNTLMIQAITAFKSGNLAVILKGMHTPIMLTLLPGQRSVDYRVDLRLPGLGPNAATTVSSLPTAENVILLNILNGVPPAGANKLRISGGDAEVWLIGDRLFLRTRLTILSPGWISTMSSADGLHAYEIQRTPLMLASFHGKMVKLVVEGL